MFIPCKDHCWVRFGTSYTTECDTTCDYARVIRENEQKDYIIDYLLEMLEEEHMGMRGVAIKSVEKEFGIKI